jgi:stage II sporulation protein D
VNLKIKAFNKQVSVTSLILLWILLTSFSLAAHPVSLKVRLFTGKQIKALNISPSSGSFSIKSGNTVITSLATHGNVVVRAENGKLRLEKGGKTLGSYSAITINPKGHQTVIVLKSGNDERSYKGSFIIRPVNGELLILNRIDLEDYVAGVVESEGGDARNEEFYRLQCLISRTYAVKNMRKHEAEEYNFCDQVHCQHYKSRGRYGEILKARDATRGKVIVDTAGRLISAAFHANSGGETVCAADVWSYPESYLKPVTDSFSLKMPKAYWKKTMAKSDYLTFLRDKYNYPVDNKVMRDSAFNFTQEHRKLSYVGGITLKTLRADLELRSTFFSMSTEGDSLVISGRGFGHGVGLSQEGAMYMARAGYKSEVILNFYYNKVRITSLTPGMIPKKP